jgi:hypothetical protein
MTSSDRSLLKLSSGALMSGACACAGKKGREGEASAGIATRCLEREESYACSEGCRSAQPLATGFDGSAINWICHQPGRLLLSAQQLYPKSVPGNAISNCLPYPHRSSLRCYCFEELFFALCATKRLNSRRLDCGTDSHFFGLGRGDAQRFWNRSEAEIDNRKAAPQGGATANQCGCATLKRWSCHFERLVVRVG